MYLEKRSVDGKIRYWLAHSFREGGKVHKIRKLLGTDLSKEVLEDRKKKAEKLILEEIGLYKVIKDPLQRELTKKEIEYIENLEKQANIKVMHLSEAEWKLFSKIFTYNTNAIEGSKLNAVEVKDLIDEDKWPKEKSKQDIAEAYGVHDAIEYIRKTKEHVSIELIKNIHHMVFKNSKSFAGELRKKGEEVVVQSSTGAIVHEGAPQTRVVGLLKELVDWYEKNKHKYNGLILAAVIHNQFENIHPFADGNGRVGRILMNNILIKHRYPPVNIDLEDRTEYYQALQKYEKEHNIRPTIEFLIKSYEKLKKQIKE